LVVPHDFVDFTNLRNPVFYGDALVTHVDMSQPFCPEIPRILVKSLKKCSEETKDWDFLCTEGPRFETTAEIKMFKRLGSDLVGKTAVPDSVLARELEMCKLQYVLCKIWLRGFNNGQQFKK
jgi:5'-methylthioadenosine phosphorylase